MSVTRVSGLGWFSMGRADLDDEIRELIKPAASFGVSTIEHSAFAATDNAAFMAEGVPNLIMLQDESLCFTVHHSVADTFDKADARDFATCVATLAVTAFTIADQANRFGRRLSGEGEEDGCCREQGRRAMASSRDLAIETHNVAPLLTLPTPLSTGHDRSRQV